MVSKVKRKYDCDEEGHANDGSCLCFQEVRKCPTCECGYCQKQEVWKDLGAK
jgi:hypothetical protein